MRMRRIKSQSILEFSILIAIIAVGLFFMQVYVKRAYQGQIKQQADSVSTQYSPGHSTSHTVSTMTNHSISYTGGVTNSADGAFADGVTVPIPNNGDADGKSLTFSTSTNSMNNVERTDSFALE